MTFLFPSQNDRPSHKDQMVRVDRIKPTSRLSLSPLHSYQHLNPRRRRQVWGGCLQQTDRHRARRNKLSSTYSKNPTYLLAPRGCRRCMCARRYGQKFGSLRLVVLDLSTPSSTRERKKYITPPLEERRRSTYPNASMYACVCSVVCTCCPSVYAVRVTGRSVQWLPPTSQTLCKQEATKAAQRCQNRLEATFGCLPSSAF